jgi:photosystem II stability/assembly factor-like uncharacterized protein
MGLRAATWLVGASLAMLVSACDGKTQGSAVSAEKAKPFHRFDHFQSVAAGDKAIVAVGAMGTIVTSADAGATWTRTDLPGAPGMIKVTTCGNGSFVSLDFNGIVWTAEADAKVWTEHKTPATDSLLDVTCTADNHVWVVGARGAIMASVDNGANWTDKSLTDDVQLLNIQFPSTGSGVIAGEFGRVLTTHDSGGTWTEVGSLGPDFYPYAMDFFDDQHGLVVGLSGSVQETKDGGKSWVRTKVPSEAPLYGVLASAPGGTMVVGAAGTAFRQVSGTWQSIKGLPITDMRGLTVTPTGVFVAGSGLLSKVPDAPITTGAAN